MVALLERSRAPQQTTPGLPTHVMSDVRGKRHRLLEEHLDPSRLDALHRFFAAPYQRGLDLFADLWHAALLQPSPESEPLSPREAGPCLMVQSLPVLARQLGWSYDALSQYLTLFSLLGLIKKRSMSQRQGLCLLLPAGPYQLPPTWLSDLDALLARPARRPKLKRLARQIHERALSAGAIQASPRAEPLPPLLPDGASQKDTTVIITLASHLTQLTAEVTALQVRLKQTEQLVRDLLASHHMQALPRQDTPASICPGEGSELLSLCQADMAETRPVIGGADAADRTNRPVPIAADLISCHALHRADVADESRSTSASKVDRADMSGFISAAERADVADVITPTSAPERGSGEKCIEPLAIRTDVADGNTHPSAERADSNEPIAAGSADQADGNRRVSARRAEMADAHPLASALSADVKESLSATSASRADTEGLPSAERADAITLISAQVADTAESAHVNVTILSFLEKNTNVHVQQVADFLCQLFGEPASKQGIYAKLIRQGCNQPETIAAAALYALLHFHRDGTIENPAAFFIARCKSFHQTGIPQEAALVLTQYGHLTVQQFLEALRQDVGPALRRQGGLERIVPLCTPRPVPKEVDCPFPILKAQIPLASGAGMSKQEAERLCWQVNRELTVRECRCGLLALPDQTYAVLIDAGMHQGIKRQVVLYSRAQWQQEREDVHRHIFDQRASTEVRERFRQHMQQQRRQRWLERLNP
jgi:hypothetical protein